MKSGRTCHECRSKKWSAANLRKALALTLAGAIQQFDCQSRHPPGATKKHRASCQPPDIVTGETPLTPFLAHFPFLLALSAAS